MNEPLPEWVPFKRIIGPAEGGGWVLSLPVHFAMAEQLRREGWSVTPSGPKHTLARKRP